MQFCIGHEGAGVFAGGGSDLLQVDALRAVLAYKESGKDQRPAQILITNSSPEALLQATHEALEACRNERSVNGDIGWVCKEKGQAAAIKQDIASGNFNGVRTIFNFYQAHDDQLKNRLFCQSGDQLRTLVDNYCANPPPSTPNQPSVRRYQPPKKR